MIQDRFADYVASLHGAALSLEVIRAARRVVLDWFAAVLPGGTMAPATLLTQALAEELGRGRAMLFPSHMGRG